jgi:hypothetical protein
MGISSLRRHKYARQDKPAEGPQLPPFLTRAEHTRIVQELTIYYERQLSLRPIVPRDDDPVLEETQSDGNKGKSKPWKKNR